MEIVVQAQFCHEFTHKRDTKQSSVFHWIALASRIIQMRHCYQLFIPFSFVSSNARCAPSTIPTKYYYRDAFAVATKEGGYVQYFAQRTVYSKHISNPQQHST